jgi:hypothetical protein
MEIFVSSAQSPLLPNATRALAKFAAETQDREIPPDVLEHVKLSFLDGLGVCLRGTTFPWTRMVREVVQEEGGNKIASLWGIGTLTSLTTQSCSTAPPDTRSRWMTFTRSRSFIQTRSRYLLSSH